MLFKKSSKKKSPCFVIKAECGTCLHSCDYLNGKCACCLRIRVTSYHDFCKRYEIDPIFYQNLFEHVYNIQFPSFDDKLKDFT